jgi:hypothetical protein
VADFDGFAEDVFGGDALLQSANSRRHRAIRWRSRDAMLRWLAELLRRGGRIQRLTLHESPQIHSTPRETVSRGEQKATGRRRKRPRKASESEGDRKRRLAAERSRAYRARKNREDET